MIQAIEKIGEKKARSRSSLLSENIAILNPSHGTGDLKNWLEQTSLRRIKKLKILQYGYI
jgi:hypothetical protein